MQNLVEEKVNSSLKTHKEEMLQEIGTLFEKISGNSNISQLNKISSIVTAGEKFKRKNNEEQFKYNSKVDLKLEEAANSIDTDKMDEARQHIAEAKSMIAHRQKLIKMADTSELGWRVVNEYEANPLASDSDDERRIYKAEARANRKLKAERAKKTRAARSMPYRKQTSTYRANVEQVPVPSSQSSTKRPPGLCFSCGKPGHWKGAPECTATNTSNNKISTVLCSVESTVLSSAETKTSQTINFDPTVPKYVEIKSGKTEASESKSCALSSNISFVSSEQLAQTESPVGRLKDCISQWRLATDSLYILDVVENGYKLPFKDIPERVVLKNNKSARENPSFVLNEIECLLKKGIVSRSAEVPHVVNPLTVAYNRKGKPRLVLDCRHINPCLHLFKIKFEDIRVAEEIFEENSFLFTYDLKGAYHHISIFSEHRRYLGFSFTENGQKA